MIFIIDNGKEYSDHRFYFIEHNDEAEVRLAVRRGCVRAGAYGHPFIAAIAPSLTILSVTSRVGTMKLDAWEDGRPLEAYEFTYLDASECPPDLLPEGVKP